MRLSLLPSLLFLVACHTPGSTPTTTDTALAPGYCGVRDALRTQCAACHSGATAQGGLDLTTDPSVALVNAPSPEYSGRTLVVPGDSSASFLVIKLKGTMTADEGLQMPPGSSVNAATLDAITAWIDAGASTDCTTPGDTDPIAPYHPSGWSDGGQHGIAADHQADQAGVNCTVCHGADLTGGTSAVSCDGCHTVAGTDDPAAWRTDCTFCHGGDDDDKGSPPADVEGETGAQMRFAAHTEHVDATRQHHAAYDCTECHAKPTDALSPGHFLVGDDTRIVAENDFSHGLSRSAQWSYDTQTCSNLYCHGNGQGNNGTVHVNQTNLSCHSCHPDSTQSNAWSSMSGHHETHLVRSGVVCSTCHPATVSGTQAMTGPENHVDGVVEVDPSANGITWNATAKTCTGTCHFEFHNNRGW